MFAISSETPIPCRDTDPELFFSGVASKIERAKRLCSTCRVQLICLEQALEFERDSGEQLHGVHGGLTPAERTNTTLTRVS